MKFTFGIITKSDNNFGSNDPSSSDKTNIIKAIESINKLNIPEFEIIVVGGDDIYEQDNIIHFKFDDTINPLWITAKKNIIIMHINNIIKLCIFCNYVLLYGIFT